MREYEPLLRFAYLICGDAAEAQDLVQDAFVKLSTARSRIYEDGFPAYARRTMVNLRASSLRRRTSERRAVAREAARAPSSDPAEHAALHDVHRALLALPVRQRACLVLRHYEGMRDREIADTLGMSVSAVKKSIERASKRLARELGDAV